MKSYASKQHHNLSFTTFLSNIENHTLSFTTLGSRQKSRCWVCTNISAESYVMNVWGTSMAAPSSPGAATESGSSAAAAWARPENLIHVENATLEAFKVELHEKVVKHIKSKGVGEYLTEHLGSIESRTEFAKYLYEIFPESDDIYYHQDARLPPVSEADMGTSPPLPVHLSMLGITADCSNKPYPGEDVFGQLSDNFAVDGFMTSSEPLMVSQSRDGEVLASMSQAQMGSGTLCHFSLGYIKGFARVSSIMCWVHRMWKVGLNVKNHPKLYQSLSVVYVHHLQKDSKLDEALATMKFSARGHIRKKTNIIQTVVMIENLYKHGLNDFTIFIRKWNGMSGTADRIVGRKSMAIKLLYETASCDARELLLKGIGKHGWDSCPWSEDTLASKKLYPKFQFPAKTKKWVNWLKTDDQSMQLVINHVQMAHDKKPEYMRKKLEVAELDHLCERAAFVIGLLKWVPTMVPIKPEKLTSDFVSVWAKGADQHLDVELKVALIDKHEDYDPLVKIAVFKTLIDEQMITSRAAVGEPSLSKKMALDVDEFQLLMKHCNYDVQLHTVWIQKCYNVMGGREHAKQEWKLRLRTNLIDAATLWMENNCLLLVWDPKEPEETIKSIMDFKRSLQRKLGFAMTSEKTIPNVIVLNWTCPTLIPGPILEAQQHKKHILIIKVWASSAFPLSQTSIQTYIKL